MPREAELAFSGGDLNEARWREILETPYLRKLVIWGGSLASGDLARIGRLRSLRELALGELAIDDGIFGHLRTLENLELLNLAYTNVHRGFEALAGLPLRQIQIEGCPMVDDETMAQLARIASLRHIEAHMTRVTDAGVAAIGNLPLEVLWLGPRITDRSLEVIANIPTIRQLDLCAPGIADDGVRKLAGLPDLQILWLSQTRISDACVDTLAGMRSLQELAIGKTRITPEGRARLAAALPHCKIAA